MNADYICDKNSIELMTQCDYCEFDTAICVCDTLKVTILLK